ncbi:MULTISPECIES: hypothetical protein [Vibrio]|uniref:Transposase n=1 Tax=Vibrio chanodichtyis TaxID=3027932 RepID=A0ABT5V6Q3_9VIBR|nr:MULTISPECIES: hypothetical protein [Vibrio]MDE1516000.1 hypothetical protein [Vibrio chanodichtyis]
MLSGKIAVIQNKALNQLILLNRRKLPYLDKKRYCNPRLMAVKTVLLIADLAVNDAGLIV